MSTEENKESLNLNESRIASTEQTIAGSVYDDEKVIDMEHIPSNPAADEGAAAAEQPANTPPRPTGIRFYLIFLGYVLIFY
jgi:hypothetical protein